MAKAPKYPKSLGACADLLYAKRQARLDADKVAAALKTEENLLEEHIINTLDKDSAGAVGQTHKAIIQMKSKPVVRDWDAFNAFAYKRKMLHVLVQKRLSENAVQELLDDPKLRGGVPGVEIYHYPKVSLTKK